MNPVARKFRREIYRLSRNPYSIKALQRELAVANIDCAIDIGANVGQFALDLRHSGFHGQIFSFEPILEIFRSLEKNSKSDPNWKVINLGISNIEGSQEIHVSGNDALSSSFLKINENHVSSFANSDTKRMELVKTDTLLNVLKEFGISPENTLLKLDVQGLELSILKSLDSLVSIFPIIYLELSLSPLYEEEADFIEILDYLKARGHRVVDIFRGEVHRNRRLAQIDAITLSIGN
jgi:FkbM family methyltransferase